VLVTARLLALSSAAVGRRFSVDGLEAAEAQLGHNLIGPQEIARVLGMEVDALLTPGEIEGMRRLPFDTATVERAAALGAMLVLRVPRDREGPLSIRRLHQIFPESFATKSMREGVGYLLRSEWAAAEQPFAAEVPELGWRLVLAEPLRETRGRPYAEQDGALVAWAERLGVAPGRVRRRTAVEAVYDVLLAFRLRQTRFLGASWDWTRSSTPDGAFVTVGNFGDGGLEILAYSTAVRFASLGVCPEVT
jgi:hypothetical protein